MSISTRLSTPEDVAAILELQAKSIIASHSEVYGDRIVKSLLVSQERGRQQNEETIVLAENSSGELLGFAGLSDRRYYINGIYVHPTFYRRGIGTQLLEAIEEMAYRRRYRHLSVMASPLAVEFFRQNGYLQVREVDFFSDSKTKIRCNLLCKELIPLTPTEKMRQKIWVVVFWIIVVLAFLGALL